MEGAQQRSTLTKLSELKVPLEERWQDIRNLDVYDVSDEQIGSVEDLYIDREARQPSYLIVSAGGVLGVGKKHFLIPVEEFTRDLSEEDRVRVNHDQDKVLDSPEFDPNEVPDLDFQRTIYDYYGRPILEDSSTTKITREEVAAKEEHGDVEEVEKSGEEGGRGMVASVVQKAGKGAAKGAVKGAAKSYGSSFLA